MAWTSLPTSRNAPGLAILGLRRGHSPSCILNSRVEGAWLVGGGQESGKSQFWGCIHLQTPLLLSPSPLPVRCGPDLQASRTFLPLHTLCFPPSLHLHLSLSLSLSVALASSWREAGTGHSSEGCGNEQSSSALVMSRRENSSRELMRPPRTKEATTSRGQRGGAQRSRPRRTARPQ